jgi:hypothetical protein
VLAAIECRKQLSRRPQSGWARVAPEGGRSHREHAAVLLQSLGHSATDCRI